MLQERDGQLYIYASAHLEAFSFMLKHVAQCSTPSLLLQVCILLATGGPLKLVMTAASQGAVTGARINSELMYEELGLDDNPGPAVANGNGHVEECAKQENVKDVM